jgi:hypothetical protein
VAFYLGLPMDLSTDMYLPDAAAAILRSRSLSTEDAAYLEAHRVPDLGSGAAQPASPARPVSQPTALPGASEPASTPGVGPQTTTEHTPVVTVGTIKGKTTFAELLEWGLKAGTIEQVLGKPLPPAPGMTVKDFCSQNGLDFETIRPALKAELDKLP